MTERRHTVRRHVTPADREQSIHHYVDVDVPWATRSIAVHLDHDRRRGTVDLGLFDPAGARGYSGGARDRFVVAATGATPGYVPGPLPAGTWRILLGLYEIPDEGLDLVVDVDLGGQDPPLPDPRPPLGDAPPVRVLPAPAGQRWVPGDLHCHSTHSDGSLTLPELVARARATGLGYLAVSDHNTVSHHAHLPRLARWAGIVLVPAQEVTTTRGHANCIGDVGWVDFREPGGRWVDHARSAGGLLSINHPIVPTMGWAWDLSGPPDLVEAWHWTWDARRPDPLDWWRARGGVPIGGSDFHHPEGGNPLGSPTTWVLVPDGAGPDQVVAALREGACAVSRDPASPVLLRVDDELVAVDADGTTLVDPQGDRRPVTGESMAWTARPGLHLLVTDREETVALVG